jgi:hypothetical protein
MKRRSAIRSIVYISAGVVLLPTCRNADKSPMLLKHISLSGNQHDLIMDLSETILPSSTSFPGAQELKSYEFVLTMVDDCASPEEQKIFTDGLKAFDKLSKKKFGQIFQGFTADQKKALLSDLENEKGIPGDAKKFYQTVKRYTIQSFTSSEKYMLDIQKYKMVPGPNFNGCVKIV